MYKYICVQDEVVVEEARVGVEDLHLVLAGPHHVGVAVANVRHVVDAVQVLTIQISGYKVVLLSKTKLKHWL